MKNTRHFFASTVLFLVLAPAGAALNETVPLDGYDPGPFERGRASFLLESDHADFALIATPFQKITARKTRQGRHRIMVTAGVDNGIAAPPPEREALLQDTPFLTMAAPEIEQAARGLSTAADPITAVERFVHGAITKKITGIPLLPARTILKSGAGDCTEHTVLALALLRSLGVPTRAVVGMVFVREYAGRADVFVFHMWAESWQDGRWRLVDATVPGEKNAARYVAFSYHTLKSAMPVDYLRAVGAIQNLSVRLVP
jgi:hypothetical protein